MIKLLNETKNEFIANIVENLSTLNGEVKKIRVIFFLLENGEYRYSGKKNYSKAINRFNEGFSTFGRSEKKGIKDSDKEFSTKKPYAERNIVDIQIFNIIPNDVKFSFYSMYHFNEIPMYKEIKK